MQKKRFSRKAQLTVFFIMGFFLVGIFAFVYYMAGRAKTAELVAPTEKIIADLLKTGSIPYYVGVCLETLGEDGITIAGRQGGDIFQDQGGTAPNPSKFIPLGDRVTYGISAPKLVNGTDYPYPPGYPGGTNKNAQVPKLNFDGWGKFGEVTLRRLCNTYGVNSPYMFTQYKETPVNAPTVGIIDMPICMFNIYTDTLSTQWQLEQYIQKRIVNCTNWTAIREETGYNVTATDLPNITFRLGLTDVWIDAYIPLELKVGNREPIYTIADFHQRLPVRLKMIMELASVMSMYDSYSLNFNLSRGYRSFDGNYDTNMIVRIDTPMQAAGIWEDVVSIEDAASKINGKDFVFQFARENRYPALDLVHRMSNMTEYDIMLMENETIVIDPNKPIIYTSKGNPYTPIYDPDEDNLTYYYTGWKETCNETYDFYNVRPRTACSEMEPTHPSIYFKFPNQGVQIADEWKNAQDYMSAWPRWQKWASYNHATFLVSGGTAYDDVAPHSWTTSDAYKATGRNATYTTTHDDIGPHNVTVWVCDEGGLCDYQIIRLLIIDYPILRLNGSNPYKDIPHDRASVEDLYVLTTAGTTGYVIKELGLMQQFLFNDTVEPFEIYKPVADETILRLPELNEYYERDIRYIWNFTFNRSRLCTGAFSSCTQQSDFEKSMLHPINLSVKNINTIPKTFNVTVYQCLPHRSTDYPDPWPYNKTEDAYLASHTCCSIGPEYNKTIDITTLTIDSATGDGSYFITDEYDGDFSVSAYLEDDPATTYSVHSDITDDGRINVTFSAADIAAITTAGTTSVVIVVKKKTDYSSYTPWGAWFDDTTPCYGGDVKVGALQTFEESDVPYSPPDVGVTTESYTLSGGGTFLTSTTGDPIIGASYRNDIWLSSFVRYCSGFRGNVCNGVANHVFHREVDCTPDIDESKGETEACTGPSDNFNPPVALTKTTTTCTAKQECVTAFANTAGVNSQYTVCLDGICYISDYSLECEKYSGTTFEKEWGLNSSVTGKEATGLCNPTPSCGDSSGKYDATKNDGRYVMKGAACGTVTGTFGCLATPSGAANKPEDCWQSNGQVSTTDTINKYCKKGYDLSYYSRNFTCLASGTPRNADCAGIVDSDPDSAKVLCDACASPNAKPNKIGGKWIQKAGKGVCCGDDPGEGGYIILSSGVSTTGTTYKIPPVEVSGEMTCNDYEGPATDSTSWIDNDCNGDANCEDSKCVNKRGPSGSYCCQPNSPTSASSCASAISTLEKSAGMTCDSSVYECDCTYDQNSDASAGNEYAQVTATNTAYKICVPASTDYSGANRYLLIKNIPNAKKATIVTTTNLDGSNECAAEGGKVDVYNFEPSQGSNTESGKEVTVSNGYYIGFVNWVSKDCIVSFKIT